MQGGTLGPYRLDRELGAGGMGKVWSAHVEGRVPGLDAGTVVALKVVHPHLLETPGFFQRFLREAEIGRSVRHENVVQTHGCDQIVVDGELRSFLVMEYVEGQTLRELLDDLERVPEALCRHVGREVAKGLAAIHAAGAVHRDLKPENVLITRCAAAGRPDAAEGPGAGRREGDGHVHDAACHAVKVMDLGVARLRDEATRLSQTGAFVGSLHYAAPEAFREGGRHVDGRADLHALGLVLYELACGVNPYFADDVPQTLRKVLHETPRRLGDVHPQLSPFFEELVHCLLAKDPAARFADAGALLAVLDEGEGSAWWRARSGAIRAETNRPVRRIRIPRETEVYGREGELSKLRALFEKAKAGDGQVVLIEGEAGIGKSRVVDELIGRLQRDGEELNFLFGSYPPGGAATAAGALSTAFREHLGDGGAARYLAQTPLLVPAFEALLRGDAPPPGAQPLVRDSLPTCFVVAARGIAAERTTVLLVDDLHFATEEARALFTSLALGVPGHRLLLVGTTRPGPDEKWLAGLTRLPQTTSISIGRLGPKDLVALLRDSFRSEALAASLSAQIATKSDGNPFFAFEIIRGLREGQFITQRDDGSWVGTGVIGEIRIPSSVLDLVNARVADLSDEERDLLDVASCWGFEFDPLLVGDVLGIPQIPLLRALGRIEKRHRLVRASGRRYAFDHHQVQEALYGAMSELLREPYHAALAAALEARTSAATRDPATLDGAQCVDLCEHFLRGAQGGRALRYLDAAQTHLEKGYLHAQVASLTERALAAPGLLDGAPRANALLRLCGALEMMGRRTRQEECAREAERLAEEARDDELRGRAASALGTLFLATARHRDAEEALRRALEIARTRADRKAEVLALRSLGVVSRSVGRRAEALAQYEQCLGLARENGDRQGEAVVTGHLGLVLHDLGRYAEAHAQCERWRALARETGDRVGEAGATVNLGLVCDSLGRYAEAQALFEQGLALARAIGCRQFEANATGNLGNVAWAQGRYADAQTQFERNLALSREIGDRQGEANATGNLGMVFACVSRFADAQTQFERHLALAREIGDRRGEATATGNLGVVHRCAGRFAEARALFERNVALAREVGDRLGEARALGNAGAARLALGDAPRAREALRASLDLCREIGVRLGEGNALVALGQAADSEGDAAAALRDVEQGLALLREVGFSEGVVEALVALGDLRRRAGEPETARAAFEEAAKLSREQGRREQAALALAHLACLPGADARPAAAASDAARAEAALAEAGDAAAGPAIPLLLWQASGDRTHLVAAKRRLDELLARNPEEFHEAMLRNVRVHRETVEACRVEGL